MHAPASLAHHTPSYRTNTIKNTSNSPLLPYSNTFRPNRLLQESQSSVVCPHCNRKFLLLFLYRQETTRIRYSPHPSSPAGTRVLTQWIDPMNQNPTDDVRKEDAHKIPVLQKGKKQPLFSKEHVHVIFVLGTIPSLFKMGKRG